MQAQAIAFLKENADPGVRFRPEEQMNAALETGQGLVLTQAGRVAGCSLVYKFDCQPELPIFSEIGTMRVTANGYGLQEFLAKFHLIQIRLEEYDEATLPSAFAVVAPGTASEYVLSEKSSMKRWAPPPSLISTRAESGVPFSGEKYALSAQQEAFDAAFADLRKLHKTGRVFQTPKSEGEVEIQLKWFEPALLARGP